MVGRCELHQTKYTKEKNIFLDNLFKQIKGHEEV